MVAADDWLLPPRDDGMCTEITVRRDPVSNQNRLYTCGQRTGHAGDCNEMAPCHWPSLARAGCTHTAWADHSAPSSCPSTRRRLVSRDTAGRVVVCGGRVTFRRRPGSRRAWLVEWWNGLLIISSPTWVLNVHIHKWREDKG